MSFCHVMERTHKNETVVRKTTVILTSLVSYSATKSLPLGQFTETINSLKLCMYFGTRRRLNPHHMKTLCCNKLWNNVSYRLVPHLQTLHAIATPRQKSIPSQMTHSRYISSPFNTAPGLFKTSTFSVTTCHEKYWWRGKLQIARYLI
jgi:hypothetical protein